MISAANHLRIVQENAFRDPRYGFDFVDVVRDSPEMRSISEAIVGKAVNPEVFAELPEGGLNLRSNLRHMASTLHDDLRLKVKAEHRGIWDQTLIGILPIGVVNGCVFRDDGQGNTLDQYVIGLNYGLILGCFSLADALTLEIMEGELAQYAEDGSPAFRAAVERFLSPTREVFEQTCASHSWPTEIEAWFANKSGALASIMLQFVALHEFGHVLNGDVESKNGVKTFHAVSNSIEYRREEDEAQKNWPCEFAADAYAIETLCDWAGDGHTNWPNFAQTYLFLGWLEEIERSRGRPLCAYHPPPADRKAELRRRALSLSASGPPVDYTEFIDGRLAAWSSPAPWRMTWF